MVREMVDRDKRPISCGMGDRLSGGANRKLTCRKCVKDNVGKGRLDFHGSTTSQLRHNLVTAFIPIIGQPAVAQSFTSPSSIDNHLHLLRLIDSSSFYCYDSVDPSCLLR